MLTKEALSFIPEDKFVGIAVPQTFAYSDLLRRPMILIKSSTEVEIGVLFDSSPVLYCPVVSEPQVLDFVPTSSPVLSASPMPVITVSTFGFVLSAPLAYALAKSMPHVLDLSDASRPAFTTAATPSTTPCTVGF